MTKRALKISGITVLTFVGLVLLYFAAAYCLSRIAVNEDVEAKNDVQIYIMSNGVHTDIVVPVKSNAIDWSNYVKYKNTAANDTTANYLAFGWGDKGFYLETPTWADLKFSVAFKAAFALGNSAIHATYYNQLQEGEKCKCIHISEAEYKKLVDFILNSFQKDESQNVLCINTDANYGPYDAFYEAVGSYSLFHTCNTWANNALKSCDQKASLWTPFDTGIFYHYTEE